MGDSGYDGPRLAYLLADLPVQLVVRLRSDRVLCSPVPAREPAGAGRQRVAGCQWRYWPWKPHDPLGVLWLADPWGSWAKLTHTTPDADEDEFPVLQSGPRRLWDEVEAAYRWWIDAGSPDADRWQFTVTPTGQRVQLK